MENRYPRGWYLYKIWNQQLGCCLGCARPLECLFKSQLLSFLMHILGGRGHLPTPREEGVPDFWPHSGSVLVVERILEFLIPGFTLVRPLAVVSFGA